MERSSLPSEIKGEWIWLGDKRGGPESYVFLRREFSLDEIPSSAELWIAARSFFHIFVNGTHLSYALGVYSGTGSYALNFDLTYLLSTGTNTFAVLAHNTEVARSCCNRQPDGFWCQFEIHGTPYIWSDHSWHAHPGDCYAGNRPRRSASSGFSERIDLGAYPHGWQKSGFGEAGWLPPDTINPYDPEIWPLLPFPGPELTNETLPVSRTVLRGKWKRTTATTHVVFEHLANRLGSGVYAAETYLYSEQDRQLEFELFADNPYRLFVNGAAVKEQGMRPLAIGTSFLTSKALCFRQSETVDPVGRMNLREGWNRLNIYLDVEPGTSGATIAFPSLGMNDLRVRRVPDETALPGWAVAGPLRTPMVNILGNLTVAGAPNKEYFVPIEELPVDEAVELTMFDYTPNETREDTASTADTFEQGLELKQGEYVILSLDRTFFGCPKLSLSGSQGDVVDIVTGTEINGGQLVPIDGVREHVDSVILADVETAWMSCFPKAVRHIMVVARVVKKQVRVRRGEVHYRRYSLDKVGNFQSSDDVLNRIWEVGRNTLGATVQESFLDSPAKDQTQYVPDSFLEAWACYYTFGNYSLGAKGLTEFAESQFETGEMPAACPSGVYLNIPDFSLLWPVWLRTHFMITGNKRLLDNLLPAAERLFDYFDEIADPDLGVLSDLGKNYKAYCFLDHSPVSRRGIITGLNALYSRALLAGAYLFETVNREDLAEILRRRVNLLVASIRELTWDEDRQLFADCWADGRRSESYSLQSNILALYGAMALPEHYDAIFDALYQEGPPFERNPVGNTDNPYFKYFVFETAFALGRRKWAFDYMKWYWGGMLEKGATTWWEMFNPLATEWSRTPGSSCHGYGSFPNALLMQEVAGVRAAIPGYSAIYFNPLISAVQSVNARIPTRYGHILLEWEFSEDGVLDASINANYPLAVIPELEAGIAATATIRVGEEVSIFTEEPEF